MMQEQDFFRSRIDAMINLNDALAVLATRLPWDQIETAVAAKFERQHRAGQTLGGQDMFGATAVLVGAGRSNAGRPKLPIRLMASLLYLKVAFAATWARKDWKCCSRPPSTQSPQWRRSNPKTRSA
jgi:IS5 family transposase